MKKKDFMNLISKLFAIVAIISFLFVAGDDHLNKIEISSFIKVKVIAILIFSVSLFISLILERPLKFEAFVLSYVTLFVMTTSRKNSKFYKRNRYLYMLRNDCENAKEFVEELQYRYIIHVRKTNSIDEVCRACNRMQRI